MGLKGNLMKIQYKTLFLSTFCMFSLLSSAQEGSSGFLHLGEDSLYYEVAGSGRTLLFIHDGLLPGKVWDEQFSFFAPTHRVIRYDRRGYGLSSAATGSYTHLEDLEAMFEHLGVERAVLIAGSAGGALAIDFTLDHPGKVEALVLVGAVVGGFSHTSHMRNRGGHLPESFNNEQEEILYYLTDDPYGIYAENVDAKLKAVAELKAHPRKDNQRQRFERRDPPSYLRLHEIKVPALILTGEFDIPDVQAHAGAINAGIPGSKRDVVPNAGHLIPLEQPELFNRLVRDFLEQDLP
jgi:3-oxoadipate enol-lactonase